MKLSAALSTSSSFFTWRIYEND